MGPVDQPQQRIRLNGGGQPLGLKVGREQPAQLRMPEALPALTRQQRGVGVTLAIHMAMVLLVMGGPPAGAHLAGRGSQQRADPPDQAMGLVTAMGDQPMQDSRDCQHPQQVKSNAPQHGTQIKACDQNQSTTHMAAGDEHRAQPVKTSAGCTGHQGIDEPWLGKRETCQSSPSRKPFCQRRLCAESKGELSTRPSSEAGRERLVLMQ